MKTKLVALTALGTIMFACSTELEIQSTDVPPAVSAALMAKYPDAKNVEWELEEEGDHILYEADFKSDGKRKEVHFRTDGTYVNEN